MATKKDKWDEYDVRHAADTLIEAQTIKVDKRKGFYDAVKKEIVKKAAAADRAAVVANVVAAKTKVSVGGLFKTGGNPHKGTY